MSEVMAAVNDFASQPFGLVGAACIMCAVTAFNSRRLQARMARSGMKERGTSLLLNGLNLVGGVCLLINAVIRSEIVWEVLEVYFVAIAIKGLAQSARAPVEPPAPSR
ncbi:MAG: hypothetical protein ABMA64_25140 [Myxococcota bacterium]